MKTTVKPHPSRNKSEESSKFAGHQNLPFVTTLGFFFPKDAKYNTATITLWHWCFLRDLQNDSEHLFLATLSDFLKSSKQKNPSKTMSNHFNITSIKTMCLSLKHINKCKFNYKMEIQIYKIPICKILCNNIHIYNFKKIKWEHKKFSKT